MEWREDNRSLAMLAFCAWVLCQLTAAHAATVSPSDALRAYQLGEEMNRLKGDILPAAEADMGTNSYDCLNGILNNLSDGQLLVAEIADLASISAEMRLAADEATVNQKLATQISYSRRIVGTLRQGINGTASFCSYDSFVSEKASEASRMFWKFDDILDSLQSQIGETGQMAGRQ